MIDELLSNVACFGFKCNLRPGTQGKRVAVTASTGIAGVHINGCTIHSWAGIGLGDGTPEQVVDKVMRSKEARKRWRQHDAVVLDEVSMIDGELLDKLSAVGRAVRGGGAANPHPAPFGGMQMIFVVGPGNVLPRHRPRVRPSFLELSGIL